MDKVMFQRYVFFLILSKYFTVIIFIIEMNDCKNHKTFFFSILEKVIKILVILPIRILYNTD